MKGLYTEVSNIPHVACVSREFVLNDRKMMNKRKQEKPVSCEIYSLSFSRLYQSYCCKRNAVFQSSCRVSHEVPSRTDVFLFIALRLMQNPIGWGRWLAEKTRACSREFQLDTASKVRQSQLHNTPSTVKLQRFAAARVGRVLYNTLALGSNALSIAYFDSPSESPRPAG